MPAYNSKKLDATSYPNTPTGRLFTLNYLHSTEDNYTQGASTYSKNLKKRRMASTLKVKTHKIFKNCKVRWSLKTQAMYSCTNGASLVSEDSLLPQEHRTNLHNNQTHMVLNHLCSAFPFPKYHFRIYPVPLSSGKMDEPPSVLSSSALENQNVRNWKTTIPSFGGGKLT